MTPTWESHAPPPAVCVFQYVQHLSTSAGQTVPDADSCGGRESAESPDPGGLTLGDPPPRGHLTTPGVILVVTTGVGQGCCLASHGAQDTPTSGNDPALMFTVPSGETLSATNQTRHTPNNGQFPRRL